MTLKGLAHMVAMDMAAVGQLIDAGKPTGELGMAKDDKAANGVRVITSRSPMVRDKARKAYSTVLLSVAMSPGLQNMLAADVRAMWNGLTRMVQRNEDRASIEAREDEVCEAIEVKATALRKDMREHGYGVDSMPAEDQALYFLASALATLKRTILIEYALPTITTVLPVNRYNTVLRNWTDFIEVEHQTLSEPGASEGGGVGSGGHPEREQITGPLRRIRQTWRLEQEDIDRHNESRGREGAPEWDLLNRTMEINSAVVLVDKARLVCWGSNPQDGVVPEQPADMTIPGWLYSKAPHAVNFDQVSGEDNYIALKNFCRNQRVNASWAPGLIANVLTFSASSYFDLKTQFVDVQGSQMNVIEALLLMVPGLDRIEVAREYAQIPAELAHLQGLGHTDAAYVAGGVFVGTDADSNVVNALKEAVTLHRDDPDIVAQQDGHDIMMKDNALVDGIFAGVLLASTGGTRVSQIAGVEIGYQQ